MMDHLAPADLDRFLRSLAHRVPCPVRLVLTGGGRRWSWTAFGRPATSISPWSSRNDSRGTGRRSRPPSRQPGTMRELSIPIARCRTRPHRRLGRLSVHLLEPTCWAVYKLTRYLDSDVDDLRAVLRRQHVAWRGLARLCGESLRTSPRATQLRLFRQEVEHFFRTFGGGVWGSAFDPERAVGMFRRAAGMVERG